VWDGEGNYENGEKCVIQTTAPSTITAVYYDVEDNYDWMKILFPSEDSSSGFYLGICPGKPECDCDPNNTCDGTVTGTSAFNAMENLSATPAGTQLQWSKDFSVNYGGFIICFSPIEAPTTKAPTTKSPTTKAPTTKAPTSKAPTSKAPTSKAPTTKAPTTIAPITKAI